MEQYYLNVGFKGIWEQCTQKLLLRLSIIKTDFKGAIEEEQILLDKVEIKGWFECGSESEFKNAGVQE